MSNDPCDDVFNDIRRWVRPAPMIVDIQNAVAFAFQVRRGDMTSESRTRDVAWPRQVAMYLSHRLTERSFPEIGRRFGGRDHTTVMYAVKEVRKRRKLDPELDGRVQGLIRQFGGVAR